MVALSLSPWLLSPLFSPPFSRWRVPKLSPWLFSLYINWDLIQSDALNTMQKLMTPRFTSPALSPEVQTRICIQLSTRYLSLAVCWIMSNSVPRKPNYWSSPQACDHSRPSLPHHSCGSIIHSPGGWSKNPWGHPHLLSSFHTSQPVLFMRKSWRFYLESISRIHHFPALLHCYQPPWGHHHLPPGPLG